MEIRETHKWGQRNPSHFVLLISLLGDSCTVNICYEIVKKEVKENFKECLLFLPPKENRTLPTQVKQY